MASSFDSDIRIYDFIKEILIECPKCSQCARVKNDSEDLSPGETQLTCLNCSYNKVLQNNSKSILSEDIEVSQTGMMIIGEAIDSYFHQPLWLRADCGGNELWAYNREHLEWLNDFVSAKLRERSQGEQGWNNRSLVSRLPKWLKSKKNRDQILKCIEKLRNKK